MRGRSLGVTHLSVDEVNMGRAIAGRRRRLRAEKAWEAAFKERLAFVEIVTGYIHDEVKELSACVAGLAESSEVDAQFEAIIASQEWDGSKDV